MLLHFRAERTTFCRHRWSGICYACSWKCQRCPLARAIGLGLCLGCIVMAMLTTEDCKEYELWDWYLGGKAGGWGSVEAGLLIPCFFGE